MCKVSVIVPNYNHARFLKQRIESILNQTFQDFEIILLDDCSTDESRSIIEYFSSNPKVKRVIYNEENSGSTFVQWKYSLPFAKGEFIWFAESDDYSDPLFLASLLPVITNNKNVGLVYCDSIIVNENSNIIGNTRDWYSRIHSLGNIFNSSNVVNGHKFCFDHLIFLNVLPNASAILFRKSLLENNLSWLDVKLRNSGDWKLWINFSLVSDIGYIDKSLNYFRKHSNNVTGSLLVMKLEAITILKELIRKVDDYDEKSKLYNSLFTWSFQPAFWINKFYLNHSNFRYYFKRNLSIDSVRFLLKFTFIKIRKNLLQN